VTSDDIRGLAADRPAVHAPDTMNVRGRLRGFWLALWLAGAAGCIAVGVYGDTPEPESTPLPGSHAWWLPLFLFLAAVVVVLAVRSFGRASMLTAMAWSSGTRFGPPRFPGAILPPSSSKVWSQRSGP
jgi:hypothetical protein